MFLTGCGSIGFLNDNERIPLRQRVFLRQLAESPSHANVLLLEGLPEHHRLWGLIRFAVISEDEERLRAYFYRFLKTRARRRSGRMKAICAAADLYLLSRKLDDFAEMRYVAFELVPDRIEPDEEVRETISTMAIACGFAGDNDGVEEIEPWVYSLDVDPTAQVIAELLLMRPSPELPGLFECLAANERDAFRKMKINAIAKRTDFKPPIGFKWGPLFRPKREGWHSGIVRDDDFVFLKPARLIGRG